jgi:hypothetical protein
MNNNNNNITGMFRDIKKMRPFGNAVQTVFFKNLIFFTKN